MVENNKLQLILKEQGLEKDDIAKMVKAFGGPFEEVGDLISPRSNGINENGTPNILPPAYLDIVVTKENDTAGMQKAREARLLLKKARTTVENKRKDLKADIVKQGRAIDSVARFVKEEIEPAEEYLQLQEDFAKIAAEGRALKSRNERIEKLTAYTDDISLYNLDAMTDEQFDALLANLKAGKEAKEAEAKRVEDERIAKEKAEAEAIKAQQVENERLKAEAVEREAEQAKKDAAAKVEADRIQAEADAKIAVERAEREKLEQQNRDREAAEAQTKKDAEAKEREAALAPDKEKLIAFAAGLMVVRGNKLPAVTSPQAQELMSYVSDELLRLAKYINLQAKEL